MPRRRIAALLVLAGTLCVSSSTSVAATARTQDIAPFAYSFRVVDFSVTATLTYAKREEIRYRLVKPSVARSLYYLGPRPTNPSQAWKGTFAGPAVDVVAEATYKSPDPSCTSTISYKPAGNKIVQVFVRLDPPRGALKRVSAGVGRIPLAEPHPGQDGGCGKPVMGGWYQDMVAYAPAKLLSKPRITITGHDEERFRDPGIESIEWSLKVVLQRLSYRRIDCATHPGC